MNRPIGRFNQQRQRQRTVRQSPRVSNKNVIFWVALGLLYFLAMPIAIIVLVGLYYFGKIKVATQWHPPIPSIQVAMKWKEYVMPALGLLALGTFFLPQAYMILRVSTFVLFILYFCRRFKMRMA